MTINDYIPILPWVGTAVAIIYALKVTYQGKDSGSGKSGAINKEIDKSNPKVATMVDIEDLGEKTAFCRCWKSKKFPYCDGAHGKHNTECGDNVGPLVIKRNAT